MFKSKLFFSKNQSFNKISKANLHIDNWNKIKSISRELYKNQYLQEEKTISLSREFIYKTFHFDNDNIINITPLVDHYNINSSELLTNIYIPLYTKNYYSPNNNFVQNLQSAAHILEKNNFHIKKIDDIELNISFRKNDTANQIINMKKFDSIHGNGKIYELLLNMLNHKYIFYGYKSIYSKETLNTINDICLDIANQNIYKAKILCDEFINNTVHKNCDTYIDITPLCKKYNILWAIKPEHYCCIISESFYYRIIQLLNDKLK